MARKDTRRFRYRTDILVGGIVRYFDTIHLQRFKGIFSALLLSLLLKKDKNKRLLQALLSMLTMLKVADSRKST